MSEIHIGPHTELRKARPEPEHPERFDREIDLRGILWTAAGLLAVAVVVHVLIWYLLAGFGSFDERRDPEEPPLVEAREQPPPPEPRLQTAPEADLMTMRQEEDKLLGQPSWVDRAQGTVRVPIEVAMEVIAARGLAPEVVGGQPGAWAGGAMPPAQQAVAPGATVQMSRQTGPAEPQALEVSRQPGPGAQSPATPPERR